MIDTHAHLNDERLYQNRKDIVQNAMKVGVNDIVCVAYDLPSSLKACEIASEFDNVYATIGVHPHDAKNYDEKTEKELINLAKNKKIVAVGEIGLDFYYDLSDRQVQKEVFIKQLQLADRLSLPVVIHTRDAQNETLEILNKYRNLLNNGGIIHCFNENLTFANNTVELGFYIGIGGMITFQNNQELRDIIKNLPLDKIILETDCPYLTPYPFRKETNEPKFIPVIAQKLAEIYGLSCSQIDKITTLNAQKVYKI